MRLLTLPKKPKLIVEFYEDGVVGFTKKSNSITLNDSYIEVEFEDIEFLFEDIKKLKKPKRKSYYVPVSQRKKEIPTEAPTLPPTEAPTEIPKKVDFKRDLRLETLDNKVFVYNKVFYQGWGKNVSPGVRYYYKSENASRKASINDVIGDESGRIL